MARLRNITTVVGFAGVPVGSIVPYGGSTAPDGWLFCDGTAISRTTYASLFSAVNTIHGAGDGSTTFNIPDIRQRFILGKAVAGTGAVLGASGGNIDHSHSLPAHYHAMGLGADLTIGGGAHNTALDHSHSAGNTGAGTAHTHSNTLATGSGTAHSHGHTLGTDTHSGHVHDATHGHTAPSTGLQSADHAHSGTTGAMNSNASHSHGYTDPQHEHGQQVSANNPAVQGIQRIDYDADASPNAAGFAQGLNTYGSTVNITINAANIDHTHSFSTGGVNANHSHTVTVNNFSGNTGTAGSHSHSVNTGAISNESSHTHPITGSISNESLHTHSFTTPAFTGNSSSDGSHSHSSGSITGRIGLLTGGVDGNSGMTSSSSNPPFYVLNHIIKY